MCRSGADALNHHHLLHFWMVVRGGGVTRARERLNASRPTLADRLRELAWRELLGVRVVHERRFDVVRLWGSRARAGARRCRSRAG